MQARIATSLVLAAFAGGCVETSETSNQNHTTSGPECFDSCCSGAAFDDAGFRCSDPLPPTTGMIPGSDSGSGDTGGSDSDGDGDTTGAEPACGVSVLLDGGFEQGTPSATWTETTTLPGSPICDASCSTDPGAAPYAGQWFAWFGGVQRPAQMSISQTFSISAQSAQLRFRFAIDAASGTGQDTFAVLVDGNTIFARTDADMTDDAYGLVPLTLDQWADGQPHVLRLQSEILGGGLTSFFVDEIELVGCGMPGPDGSDGLDSSGTSGAETDGGSSDSGSSDSGSSDSGSSDGGSSGGTTGS